jgi:cytochrome b561
MLMRGRVADMLFWTAIGFVAASFVLAFIGVETSPGATRELIFRWHESFGLLSLIALLATFAAYGLGKRRIRGPMRNWLPRFRAAITVIFYGLLILQPFSGWLLASHEASQFRFLAGCSIRSPPPATCSPSLA